MYQLATELQIFQQLPNLNYYTEMVRKLQSVLLQKPELSNIAIGEQVNIWMPDNILTKSSFCPIYNKTTQENKMTTADILR